MNPEAYPLQWPMTRARWSGGRVGDTFRMSASAMTGHLHDELDRLGAEDIVISSNKKPYSRSEAEYLDDPGVAVYFKRKGQSVAMACDKYQRISANLHGIGLALEAIRTIERHGTGDMVDAAFTGFKALPDTIITPAPDREKRPWWVVLGTTRDADAPTVKKAYRTAQATAHPDAGGSSYDFQEVQHAFEEWKNS